jgi:hypothetical protein
VARTPLTEYPAVQRRHEIEVFIFARFHARPGNEGAVAEALLDVLALRARSRAA